MQHLPTDRTPTRESPQFFKFWRRLLWISMSLISPLTSANLINIDGRLDEPAWQSARVWSDYVESIPFSLAAPKHTQKVLILEDDLGIYFGFVNDQAKETVRANQHQRDNERANADRAGVSIDFDGDGLTGYGFSVSAGGSVADTIYRNENQGNPDWDADWDSATFVDDEAWYAEIFIPWTVAPMKAVSGPSRTIKLAFWRMVISEGRVNTSIPGNPRQEKFLSLFHPLDFKNNNPSKIDFFPYVNATQDRIKDEVDTKAGMEIFWKIDAGKQLNIALNPDFGQVESDELVVNFSSSETFYSDKRPFFSENHSLFDVKSNEIFYIINTRRIGAAPDYDCSRYDESLTQACADANTGISDIDAAVRYTQQGESIDLGFLGAIEADSDFSEGRRFYALRSVKNGDASSIGYLGTFVQRPFLDRRATVHSADWVYRPSETVRLSTVAMRSSISESSRGSDRSGVGLKMEASLTPDRNRWHYVGAYYFDNNLDITDMGYQVVENWAYVGNKNGFKITDFAEQSPLLASDFELGFAAESNADLELAGQVIEFGQKTTFKNTSSLGFESFYRRPSRDFWMTRNNAIAPFINKPSNYSLEARYMGPSGKRLSYFLEVERGKGSTWFSAMGYSTSYTANATYAPKENLTLSLTYQHSQENDWLNWIEGNLLGTYSRKQRVTVAALNWFRGQRHEFRLKAQMVAFTARDPRAYLGDARGALTPASVELPPFSLSDLAFQARYRFELLPLAYLYVVYSRGGRIVELDEEDGLGALYRRPWREPQADQFTVKVRYRF